VRQPDEVRQQEKECDVIATLQETDTIVTSFVLEDRTEFALAYDGEQEYWYFVYRQREYDGSSEWPEGWRVVWKGSYESAKKNYVDMALDMTIEASPYASPPVSEEQAMKQIDKIRGTEI
jgi:hypothetical protein